MAFVKKTWKDRIAEFPTRRRLTKEDNTSELVTVAREEGTLSQEGDAFSAENMNDLENRIDAEFTEVNGNLSVRYNTDTDTVQILYNGTWVDWKSGEQTYIPLFVSGQGSVNTDISGGFTKTSGSYNGTVNTNAITMSASNATDTSGTYAVVVGSGKMIDRTVYKKIKFHANVSGSSNVFVNLNTVNTNYGARLAPKDSFQRIVSGDNILDISNAESNGYIVFFIGVNAGTVSVTIDSIVLCK